MQEKCKNFLVEQKKEKKSKYREIVLCNTETFIETQERVIGLFNCYDKIKCEFDFRTTRSTYIKILAPKQMFQILPIALVKVIHD